MIDCCLLSSDKYFMHIHVHVLNNAKTASNVVDGLSPGHKNITDIFNKSLEEEKGIKNVMETCVLVSKTTLIIFLLV